MTDSRDDAMLGKVRKLLAKAADPATTPAEAETYTAKAAELAAAYGIDAALVAAASPGQDPVGDRVVVLDRPYASDKAGLLGAVALALRCRAVRRVRHEDGVKELSLHLFGQASDLRRVEVLYTSLLLQAIRDLTRTPVPRGEHKAAFRRSWLAGFTRAVELRLTEAERRAASEAAPRFRAAGTSSALVLADRAALVEEAMGAAYPRLGAARSRSYSGGGMVDGWAAGHRASLGGATPLRQPGRGILPG